MPDSRDSNATTSISDSRKRTLRFMSIVSIASSCFIFACMACCFLTTFILKPKLIETPEGATEVVGRITEWSLPTGFEGQSGMTIDNPLVKVDFAKFAQRQGRGVLVVGQIQSHSFLFSDERKQIQQIVEKFTPELKPLKVDQTRKLKTTIRELPAKFLIERGEDRASTTRLLTVTGFFRGLRDDAILILQCEEEVLTDDEINQFLKSIQ